MSYFKMLFAKEHWLETTCIVVVGFASLLAYSGILPTWGLLAAMTFGLFPLVRTALVELITHHKIGTELFITTAVLISIVGREYLAGAIVLMIILIAEYIASISSERVRASIKSLIDTAPKKVIVKRNGVEQVLEADAVCVGDIVLVRAGDKIPVDGTVIAGEASVNQAPITGESMPQDKQLNSTVFAGTIVATGALDIRVDTLTKDTVLARIVALVEEAESGQAPIEKFTDKIAAWLIPIVFVFVSVVYYFTRDIQLIIALLIFTSPAELGLATPLVTISAIARAAKEGILVKGGLYLEMLAKVDTFVFDKTGTLTIGSPLVEKIVLFDTSFSEAQVLTYAASVDRRSSHPLAQAILLCAKEHTLELDEPTDFTVIQGRGVQATLGGNCVLLGNSALMQENHLVLPEMSITGPQTIIYLAVGNIVAGAFYLTDSIRIGAKEAIQKLKNTGVSNIVMLSGDNKETAEHVGHELGIIDVRANLLPEDKIAIVRQLQADGALVAMVGDGINDAPALVQASVGIAMGAVGTQVAMEAADIVLMHDDLLKISRARAISKKAYKTIKENIFVGVGVVHVTGIILVLTHVIGPIEAAAIHLVPDTLVFLNSVKLLKVTIDE